MRGGRLGGCNVMRSNFDFLHSILAKVQPAAQCFSGICYAKVPINGIKEHSAS